MKGQAAIEYLMTYGWMILIVLIVGGVIAYYNLFAPQSLMSPTVTGCGLLQIRSPWDVAGSTGQVTLTIENTVGQIIDVQGISYKNAAGTTYSGGTCASMSNVMNSGERKVIKCAPSSGPGASSGTSYSLSVMLSYLYSGETFVSTCHLTGTYS